MPRKTWRAALAAYATPSAFVMLLLGFAAGMPYMLVFSTLSVWLREAGVARETIGYASLIGLAYAFKWVWSPLLDQWRLPFLGRLGRRRSWLVLSQSLVVIGLIGMGFCDPQKHLSWLIAIAVLVAFSSATQDIAIDAYRLEIAEESSQAALAASYMSGYRIAALLATAGALYIAEGFGSTGFSYKHSAWAGTYILFGLLMLPALVTTLVMRESPVPLRTQLSAARYGFSHQLASVFVLIILLVSVPAMFTQLYYTDFASVLFGGESWANLLMEDRAFLRAILYVVLTTLCLSSAGRRGLAPVLTPVNDFIRRYRWQAFLLLGLIATYRMSDTVMGVMANVFYIDQGFTKDQIASVSKLFGLVMTLLGAGFGGLLIVRFGILPILFFGGAASAATNLLFLLLADMGANLQMLILTISLDNFSSGLATSAFVAYLSSLTNLKFSATQYALLSSIMLLLPRLIGGYSGVMVERFGYHDFFMITALMGIPTLIMIAIHWSQEVRRTRAAEATKAAQTTPASDTPARE
ncbi:AmpG family muropeptide MFS transporter [Pseudomonas sp. 10B1]|uniref:AmpG family muropeptide MFS transporter n=1 Tax=unclassified Pseudomonas TaxID=196821 RepID=UPI002AB33E49|nr:MULTISPECIES: AmpG family muropeptide MFS transporter [unclassified Pseudomonas]MDY7561796.1 AmpG family muropeptide MFS transporter [Pseudomonas sp. AB6]MEA9978900.1 AmpG family muropeptide MFS transporter [Pseudomonas sp. RTS4]MEA9995361.1 AmpG family muropeptide MFS transporter [Pseudomonas sp. AA4]MEB0087265.1 AmpG family muropeptide MFS transporter [Pseudomonas sp. RTI1]MEB0127467.1 AmpG family muropeptide MFS transporter [Pseudomonas sp. CCC1.2]